MKQLSDIRRMRNPAQRLRIATIEAEELQERASALAQIRREAIAQMRRDGFTQAEIAAEAGVSAARIGQLAAPRPARVPT